MAFAGSLVDIPLQDVLQLVASQGKSGTLTLTRGQEQIRIIIAEGKAVDADSTTKPLERRLGTMLERAGKLTEVDLARALALQGSRGGKLGRILVAEGLVAVDAVRRALRLQLLQTIHDAIRWSDGAYSFERGEVDYDRDHLEPVGFQGILMDSMRMIDEWPILEKRLARRDLVLHPVPCDEAAISGLGELETEVLGRVDGKSTIRQIVERSMHLEFDVCRTLYDLWERDLIRPAYEGRLEDLGFPELVRALRHTGAHGRLELTHGGTTRTVYFRDGDFVAARSSDPDDGIGPHLLRRGLVTRRELDLGSRDGVAADEIGERLVRLGAIDGAAHAEAVAEQMAEIIRSLFSWTEGSYRFHPGLPAGLGGPGLEARCAAIVLAGVRSIDRWSRLVQAAGPPDAIYRLEAGHGGLLDALPRDERDQLAVFARERSLDEAGDSASATTFTLYQTIWAGKILGLLKGGEQPGALATLIAALQGEAPDAEPEAPQGAAQADTTGDPPGLAASVALEGLADLDPSELLPDSEAGVPVASAPPGRGRVSGVLLGELLRRFYSARSTGTLNFAYRRQRVGLLLSHGTVVAASSLNPSHRLGQIAIDRGLVPAQLVEVAVAECRSGAIGPELVARGLLSGEQLATVIDAQIRAVCLPMFNWGEADYGFVERPEGGPGMPRGTLSSAELILAGAQEITATSQLGQVLLGCGALVPHDDPLLRFQRFRLQPEEAAVLARTNGRTLPQLIAEIGTEERETIRIVFGLLSAGIVEAGRDEVPGWLAAELARPCERPPLDQLEAVAGKLQDLDPVTLLGLHPSPSPEAIDRACARLARKYHPDHGRSPGEEAALETIFGEVLKAARVLGRGWPTRHGSELDRPVGAAAEMLVGAGL